MRPALGQLSINPKQLKPVEINDMTANKLSLQQQGTTVIPDLKHDHTNPMEYIVPVGNGAPVYFDKYVNAEEKSLHFFVLDNVKNTLNKVFTFHQDYIFLDDPLNTTNTYVVSPGKKQVWWGSILNGKLYLRVSVDNTNI
jgi:hypothetical protein